MPNEAAIDHVVHAGYALCLNALRVVRDNYKVQGLIPSTGKELLELRRKYRYPEASFSLDLECLALRKVIEALEAVEGKGE